MSCGKRGVAVKWQSEEVFGCQWLYSGSMGIKKRQTFLLFGVWSSAQRFTFFFLSVYFSLVGLVVVFR
jgi:hypothetical protein